MFDRKSCLITALIDRVMQAVYIALGVPEFRLPGPYPVIRVY